MIHNRQTTVELQGERRTIAIRRGCPQGGILTPFLWNLVVNELLEYTRNKIPSDLQGFADDLALVSTVTAPRQTNGRQGYDADTLREVTQKSLNNINLWCRKSGLKLSHLKTHVMFTKRRNWSFSRPLKVYGIEIKVPKSKKFLGIILESKLSWNEHIENVCKKAKGILMQCRKAVGPTWGFKPATMRWVYEVMVRPVLGYGATIWLNGTRTQRCVRLLFGKEITFDHAEYYETCARVKTFKEHTKEKKFQLEHTKPIFNDMNLLSLHHLYIYHTFIDTLKLLKYRIPI